MSGRQSKLKKAVTVCSLGGEGRASLQKLEHGVGDRIIRSQPLPSGKSWTSLSPSSVGTLPTPSGNSACDLLSEAIAELVADTLQAVAKDLRSLLRQRVLHEIQAVQAQVPVQTAGKQLEESQASSSGVRLAPNRSTTDCSILSKASEQTANGCQNSGRPCHILPNCSPQSENHHGLELASSTAGSLPTLASLSKPRARSKEESQSMDSKSQPCLDSAHDAAGNEASQEGKEAQPTVESSQQLTLASQPTRHVSLGTLETKETSNGGTSVGLHSLESDIADQLLDGLGSNSRPPVLEAIETDATHDSSYAAVISTPSTSHRSFRFSMFALPAAFGNVNKVLSHPDEKNQLSSLQASRDAELSVRAGGGSRSRLNTGSARSNTFTDSVSSSPHTKYTDSSSDKEHPVPFWLQAAGMHDPEANASQTPSTPHPRSGLMKSRSQSTFARGCASLKKCRVCLLGIMVMCFVCLWINFALIDFITEAIREDGQFIPLHKLCDGVLAVGSLVGLAFVQRIQRVGLFGFRGTMLGNYAKTRGFMDLWKHTSELQGAAGLLLWLTLLVVHGICISQTVLSSSERFTGGALVITGGLVVVSFAFIALALSLLHVTNALVIMVDNFCEKFMECAVQQNPDIPVNVHEWNMLQAILRRGSVAMTPCFLVIHTTGGIALLLPIGEVLLGGEIDFWPWLSAILRAAMLLAFVCRLTFRAAEVSGRCQRVPSFINSFINSFSIGDHSDVSLQDLVDYVNNSNAGFHICEAKLTATVALKFVYFVILSTITVITKVVSSD